MFARNVAQATYSGVAAVRPVTHGTASLKKLPVTASPLVRARVVVAKPVSAAAGEK